MSAPTFDFQALAARAGADNPDAALFAAVEADGAPAALLDRPTYRCKPCFFSATCPKARVVTPIRCSLLRHAVEAAAKPRKGAA
jgi:hypothetical protein